LTGSGAEEGGVVAPRPFDTACPRSVPALSLCLADAVPTAAKRVRGLAVFRVLLVLALLIGDRYRVRRLSALGRGSACPVRPGGDGCPARLESEMDGEAEAGRR
jgi:hypothetical protein